MRTSKRTPKPAGEEVSGFTDLHPIGQGGFSTVYRARQPGMDRVVALKVLSVELADGAVRKRFLREVQLTGRLTGHPHVVTVLEAGSTRSGRPYLAMEYFERGSLKARLDEAGPLPPAEVATWGAKVAGALAAAHGHGIVHRDVKPQNILLSRYGEPALADFGIARLLTGLDRSTHTEALTPYHAAPEVLDGATPDAASDVYSLGSTLYQLLSGRPAYARDGDGIASLLLRVLNEPPPPIRRPDVPAELTAVVLRAMARRPDDRFPDADAMARALDAAAMLGGGGSAAKMLGGGGSAAMPAPIFPPVSSSPGSASPTFAPPSPVIGFPDPAAVLPDTEELTSPGMSTVEGGPAMGLTVSRPGRAVERPAPGASEPHSRKHLYLAAAAVSALAVAAGAYWTVRGAGSPTVAPPGNVSPTPSPTPSGSVPPVAIDAARPTAVVVQDRGASVEVHWTLPAGDQNLIVVQSAPAVSGVPPMRSVGNGATTATVSGLDPQTGYCFQIGAVVRIGNPSVVAWSAPACIRGAVAASTGSASRTS